MKEKIEVKDKVKDELRDEASRDEAQTEYAKLNDELNKQKC